ncbi:hypothetical protein Francci3_0026 [Frankia casuarinae]|uniref:Uncharacterized protein n=1 Tax=Frankia casuarinae (strain DSM 45818 / CECT 9043 / HFP020203 / CcI3) TaxID=106370 RepID=Q2JH22_FRACC|nr:hypothetical protein Francci3_0026 [Frankia casuarinae]
MTTVGCRALSSPHARGSSPSPRTRPVTHAVVPARAGIFRFPSIDRAACDRRPRTRGDLPVSCIPIAAAAASSPHARGSSYFPEL